MGGPLVGRIVALAHGIEHLRGAGHVVIPEQAFGHDVVHLRQADLCHPVVLKQAWP